MALHNFAVPCCLAVGLTLRGKPISPGNSQLPHDASDPHRSVASCPSIDIYLDNQATRRE